jgi:hypothetical protein
MITKYAIGDMVFDSMLNCHYLIEGFGYKKGTAAYAYAIRNLEKNRTSYYTVENMDTYKEIYKVA